MLGQTLLFFYAYSFQCKAYLSYVMVFIYYDLCMRKELLHQLSISSCHIHDNELDLFSVRESHDMMPYHFVSSIRKDIYYFMVLWIGQYALEFLPFCIALELIYCQYLRELSCFEVDLVYDLCSCRRRHIVIFGDAFDAATFFQLFIYLQVYSVREMMISGKKIDMFIESLAAGGADMAALFQMKDRVEAADGNVFYDLGAVIVDFAGDLSTCRAVMQTLCHF